MKSETQTELELEPGSLLDPIDDTDEDRDTDPGTDPDPPVLDASDLGRAVAAETPDDPGFVDYGGYGEEDCAEGEEDYDDDE